MSVPAPIGGNWNRRSWRNISQFQAACMIKFLVYLRYYYHLWDFEFSVQAALWIYHLSAIALIILPARKKISPSAEDDKEALPPWPPQAFREKGLT